MDLNPTFCIFLVFYIKFLPIINPLFVHKYNRFVYIGWGVVGLEKYFVWKLVLELLTLLNFSNACNAIEYPNCFLAKP